MGSKPCASLGLNDCMYQTVRQLGTQRLQVLSTTPTMESGSAKPNFWLRHRWRFWRVPHDRLTDIWVSERTQLHLVQRFLYPNRKFNSTHGLWNSQFLHEFGLLSCWLSAATWTWAHCPFHVLIFVLGNFMETFSRFCMHRFKFPFCIANFHATIKVSSPLLTWLS